MINSIFRLFERFIPAFPVENPKQPPNSFAKFVWHYAKPFWPLLLLNIVLGVSIAILEVQIFAYIGKLVDWITNVDKDMFWQTYGTQVMVMGLIVIVVLPLLNFIDDSLEHQGLMGNFPMRIRWQAHRYLLGHCVSFFNNDFAGRIAAKVMQTSLAVRETAMKLTSIFVYVLVYFTSTVVLFLQNDWRLAVPLILWLIGYLATLKFFVPKFKEISKIQAEHRALVTGRMVDSYSNIHTVKMFSNKKDEDFYTQQGMNKFLGNVYVQMRYATLLNTTLTLLNSSLIFFVGFVAIYLWQIDIVSAGAIAFALGIVMRIQGLSQWALWEVASLFENIGIVQDGMMTLSTKREIQDSADAISLPVVKGDIRFKQVSFDYGKKGNNKRVLNNIDLHIKTDEKIGVVGRSGAGKSTLVNLLLRFYDVESGQILIDGHDIRELKQESLRSQISMVSQDSSLLHRSILENIQYGQNDSHAEDNDLITKQEDVPYEIIKAATQAHAHDFIQKLQDNYGNKGYLAHVGERGVKLSGGQRQRIAIARAVVKNAPILILDEATSALDSEVELAIQENLSDLMKGRTVIAIAHRLSTIAQMDRLIVMDEGKIIEQGTHQELLDKKGLYAQLWSMQSGGFIGVYE